MAEPGEARQIEEAAAALHGVDETEDRVEPRAVRRIGLPRDDLPRERLKRLARFGNEFLEQVVHGSPGVERWEINDVDWLRRTLPGADLSGGTRG